ncbi:MAG: MerR family transcriptional regulator [Sandaracinaceae bacterium]|nr:MerR family transcriptional regulator [Sandaracinaceae bacterium]
MTTTSPKTRLPLAPVPHAETKEVPSLLPPPPGAQGEELRVGDVARLTGKTVRALHLYEELGLVEPTLRSKGGFRLYDQDAVRRVHWVTRLQDMGFSLPEIRDLLRDWKASESAPGAMQRVHDLYRRKVEETRLQIDKLRGLLGELEESLGYLETCSTCAPERVVSECSACDRHDCETHRPVLVAGFQ